MTCNLEKCYSLRSFFGMYNLERQLWYWHLLTRHCPCNLLPESASPKHEYREKLWDHPVTSSMTSSPLKKNFFCIIWDDLIIWEGRLKLCLIFQIFQNGRHFELPIDFFYRKFYTGSWIYQNDSHEHFWHWVFDRRCSSNIDGDISISKFDLFCYLVTLSMTSWIYIYIIVVISSWYLCTGSLMMISLLVFKLSWKKLLFHL